MNTSLWELLIKTALLGTERAPLPDSLKRQAAALGLPSSDAQAQTLLELLAAVNLTRKAAFPLVTSMPLPAPAEMPLISGHAARLAPLLERILAGVYARALDELLDLLARSGGALPPETLPVLLDRAARDGAFWEKIRPAVGTRGLWLLTQNPAWSALSASGEDEWATGAFTERLRWLQKTRTTNPLLALAVLEKSWRTERPEHKGLLLHALSVRLSSLDEDFLEKILTTDKKREVRQSALHLLLQIPDGQRQQELLAFFQARVAGVFSASSPAGFLKKQLPDLSEQPLALLATFLPADDVKNWRSGIVALLARLLPPAKTAAMTMLSPLQLLARSAAEPDLEGVFRAFVLAAVVFEEAGWLESIAGFLEDNPKAAIWKNTAAGPALEALADERWAIAMDRLLQHEHLLSTAGSPLAVALSIARRPWPRAVLQRFLMQLVQIPMSQQHLQNLLETAAYRCDPGDAEAARSWLHPEKYPAWRTALTHFFDVAHFRRRLWQAFLPVP